MRQAAVSIGTSIAYAAYISILDMSNSYSNASSPEAEIVEKIVRRMRLELNLLKCEPFVPYAFHMLSESFRSI